MRTNNLLPKIARIQPLYMGDYKNAMHTQFHRNQYELVAKIDGAKLPLPAGTLKAWKANIDMEVEINKQSTMSVLTKEMNDKDLERDKVLRQIFNLIRAHRLSFVEADKKAGEKLYAALKPYFGIQREVNSVESIHIVGLLKDIDKLTAEATMLGLTPALERLKMLNEEYEQLAAQRRSDAVAAKLPEARSVRRQTDEDFEVVCLCVQSAYLLASNDTDKAFLLDLINEMNRVSVDIKTSFKASTAQRKASHPQPTPLDPSSDSSSGSQEGLEYK